MTADDLVIDQLCRAAHERPRDVLLPGLTNAEAWAKSGAVASWLIAQGYGPERRALALPPVTSPAERGVLLLGALRAGALVTEGVGTLSYGRMAAASVDAAVAERRLHIDARTPARVTGGVCRHHGDFRSIAQALAD
ncbi:MAG TPA: hypothetical protein VFB13_07895 [Reyranella sp.]|jgi:hypothetical protein|nr:hypothetical protein [Reyranella sp.]